MKRILLLAIVFFCCVGIMQAAQTGSWKAYMAYSNIQDVEQGSGNIIYVLASNNIYSYNTADQSIQTFDKTNGLSDCNISHISYNKSAKRLVIIYSNQNNKPSDIQTLDISNSSSSESSYISNTLLDLLFDLDIQGNMASI